MAPRDGARAHHTREQPQPYVAGNQKATRSRGTPTFTLDFSGHACAHLRQWPQRKDKTHMAKVAFSALVADLRNKVGGNVFTKVRSGPMVRIKVSPTQPRTAAQTAVRSNFTSLSKQWDTITQAQRNGWIALASGLPQKDVFGNTYYLTGLQLFQQLNRNLQTIGVAVISDAPASVSVGAPGAVTVVSAAGPPITLTVNTANAPAAGEVPVIFGIKPLNAGRIFTGQAFTILDATQAAATAGPYDEAATYAAKYGALTSGQNVNLAVRFINNTTGAGSLLSKGQVFIG
jgi:hypothetical protein